MNTPAVAGGNWSWRAPEEAGSRSWRPAGTLAEVTTATTIRWQGGGRRSERSVVGLFPGCQR